MACSCIVRTAGKNKMVLETNDDNFMKDVLENKGRCVVKFKNNSCHLCSNLSSIYTKISEKYKDYFKFFVVDTLKNKKLRTTFVKSGVPTLYIFGKTEVHEIPDPKKPSDKTWFSEEYVEEILRDFLKKEKE